MESVRFFYGKGQRSTQSQSGLESQRCRKRRRLEKSILRLLLQYGPELEALVAGEQSLGRAAKQGNLTTVRELGAKGAKVDGDREVSSSLILAAENGHHCAMRALLELGASADAVHTYSSTALKAAAHNSHLEAVRVLLDHGASVEEHPKGKGKSAVAKAIKYKHWDVAQLLGIEEQK
jgi:ankyrin repeat protein